MSLGRNKIWQDNKPTVRDALSYMYKHDIFNDVTIQTSKDKGASACFSAHKLVLATRSPVFADMFYSSTTANSNIIALNISARAMDILLWYIYSDDIEGDNIDELLESFDAAVQYQISGFCENCVEKLLQLSSTLSTSNLCSVIKVAGDLNSNELLNECVQFIEKEPENSLLQEGFQSISDEAFKKILTELNSNVNPKTVLKAVMKWMIGNNFSERTFLSAIDFAILNTDEFLNIVEDFPDFFSKEEIRCILANLVLPKSSELPTWCKFSKNNEHCIKISLPLLYEGFETIKQNAVKIQTECIQKFSKISFFNLHGFQQDLLLKVAVQSPSLQLVVVELAFGTDYIPVDCIKLELRSNIGPGRRMQIIKYYLLSSSTHYFLLLCNETMLKVGKNFNLQLSVEATGLGNWGIDRPISNQRYRIASVSNCDSMDLSTHCSTDITPAVSLKPFAEWLLLVDPTSGEKKSITSALYFDSLKNIQKYKTYLKELCSGC